MKVLATRDPQRFEVERLRQLLAGCNHSLQEAMLVIAKSRLHDLRRSAPDAVVVLIDHENAIALFERRAIVGGFQCLLSHLNAPGYHESERTFMMMGRAIAYVLPEPEARRGSKRFIEALPSFALQWRRRAAELGMQPSVKQLQRMWRHAIDADTFSRRAHVLHLVEIGWWPPAPLRGEVVEKLQGEDWLMKPHVHADFTRMLMWCTSESEPRRSRSQVSMCGL